MNKIIKQGLIVIGGLIVFGGVVGVLSGGDSTESSSQEDSRIESQTEKQEPEEQVSDSKTEEVKQVNPTKEEAKAQYALLWGEDDAGYVIEEINVWQKAEGGGRGNVAVGNVPHNTKIEILESAEAEGTTFYRIRSSIGNVSVLPTVWEARIEAMEERPKSEWTVPADPSFPVEGWVTKDFITGLN